jgi:hypothetical protein
VDDEPAPVDDAPAQPTADKRAEIERLQARIEELEAQLATARASDEPDGTAVPASDALARTEFLVRYEERSRGTLADALDGGVDSDTFAENLRLEPHADFDTATATVDGRPYEAFIGATLAYRIAHWLVGALGTTVQTAGKTAALADLIDALPAIDRLELDASVDIGDDETAAFDIVCWSRHGEPLVVIDHSDTNEAVDAPPVATLLENATAVAEHHDSLAAALHVTGSYHSPTAIEAVEEATGGGMLSRNSKASYVKTARKQGFHCCLAEAREDTVRLTVPEC